MTLYAFNTVPEKQNEKGYLGKIGSSNKTSKAYAVKSCIHVNIKNRLKQLKICASGNKPYCVLNYATQNSPLSRFHLQLVQLGICWMLGRQKQRVWCHSWIVIGWGTVVNRTIGFPLIYYCMFLLIITPPYKHEGNY